MVMKNLEIEICQLHITIRCLKINSIKNNSEHNEAYALGCVLQNIEGDILCKIENCVIFGKGGRK